MPDPEYIAKWGHGPHHAADACLIHEDSVLLVQREDGSWALPGGFYDPRQDVSTLSTAKREVWEETGVGVGECMRASAYAKRDDEDRDPWAWIKTSAYLFEMPDMKQPVPKDDARAAAWFNYHFLPSPMYADHAGIIAELARSKDSR